MNQHRWNCLTALFLSTFIAPISDVRAQVSAPANSGDNSASLLPQSLPNVTPLTATELQADSVVPAVIQPVPQVSSLPIVTPHGRAKDTAPTKQLKRAQVGSFFTTKIHSQSPIALVSAATPIFSPSLRATAPILSIPSSIESSPVLVPSVVQPPQITAKLPTAPTGRSFTSKVTSAPIFVTHSDNSNLTKAKLLTTITNSATVQAEMADPHADDSRSAAVKIAPRYRSQVAAIPKVAPIFNYSQDRADLASFEAGLPVFIFEDDRPQQIVATAIAQVGDQIVAPEPSIAIPVERPKQSTIPTHSPFLAPSIVKIDLPSETTQPVLDKIVATQTGKASWYGAEGGSRTANGERYNPRGLTAAHRTLAFGTKVRVTSLKTGKTVIVRINDRGPFSGHRIIDVSAGAAEIIGIKHDGVGEVRVEILGTQG
jgi:rare lipoprotein A